MTTAVVSTSIAVHGESSRWVDPDVATVGAAIELVRDERSQALAEAGTALEAVVAGVTGLGAVAAGADTRRAPMTYSALSTGTHEENAQDPRTGNWGPTGRTVATVNLQFRVRALDRLDALLAELGRHATLTTHGVGWEVDEDNPAWRECRIDAVHAALDRARDYAAALGGTVVRVDEVADAGLSAVARGMGPVPGAFSRGMAAKSGLEDAGPSLTPVPQQVSATVDARVTAEVPPLN